jgi:hypothetical protein
VTDEVKHVFPLFLISVFVLGGGCGCGFSELLYLEENTANPNSSAKQRVIKDQKHGSHL